MRKVFYVLGVLIPVAALISAFSFGYAHINSAKAANNVTCTPTGFIRDGNNLTAAVIATTTTISGTVNAAGCNIGVYYGPGVTGLVSGAQVFGANYYGIVNNGGKVTITKSQIHDIGENPLNGDQHGYGIYFTEDNASTGKITSNLVWNYQKNGIVVRGTGGNATITHNTVIGQGPVTYIAQNGIEVGGGSKATVSNNIVTGNSYSGTNNASASGILIYGGSCYGNALTIGTKINNNTVIGNDVGVSLSNLDGNTCIPTNTPTKILTTKNIITNDGVNNISGDGTGGGYQAGVSDQGDADQITNNSICGLGYTPVTPPPFLFFIDVTNTNSPTVTGNTSCLDGSPISSIYGKAPHAQKHALASI